MICEPRIFTRTLNFLLFRFLLLLKDSHPFLFCQINLVEKKQYCKLFEPRSHVNYDPPGECSSD